MLAKLRVKFVSLAALTLLICLTLVLSMVFFLTDNFFDAQVNTMLTVLLENGGEMPPDRVWAIGNKRMPGGLSEELQYETRYFSVITDKDGNVTHVNTEHIFSIEEDEAAEIAFSIYEGRSNDADMSVVETLRKLFTDTRWESGKFFHENNVYYYDSREKGKGGRLYVFVDYTSRYLIVQQIYSYLLIVAGVILLVFCLLFIYFSKQLMDPFIENQERQKRFITNASHELKTPLATMKIMVESLIYQPEMETGLRTEFLGDINREIDRLSSIVTDLLTLVRMDVKDVKLSRENMSLAAVVKDTEHLLAPLCEQRNQTLTLSLQDDCDMYADRTKLQQVVYNLMENAFKYTQEGGTINVSLQHVGKNAVLKVQDNGPGIAAEHLPHIFDRFYRVDKARSREAGGTGLGLAIVNQLVVLHGGEIHVESEVGKGTTFIVEIPLHQG